MVQRAGRARLPQQGGSSATCEATAATRRGWRLAAGLVLLLGLTAGSALAVERIKVMALFPGKAMVSIDGRQRLLKAGVPSAEGVTLVSATSREAVIEVNGRRESYHLGSDIGGSFTAPTLANARITRDNRGSYTTVGSINGRTVRLLVDTGASAVAMSAAEAKRLGIPYRLEGRPLVVTTASGQARGYAVKLDRVQVGEIELAGVEGVVIEGGAPAEVLLGMTFLSRVRMEDRGNLLILQTKY